MTLDLLTGRRRVGAVVPLAAAGAANAVAILALSVFAGMVGVKTFKLKRFKIRNNGGANTWIHLGTGVGGAFVDGIPALYSLNLSTDDYDENDLPQWEPSATITCYPDAWVAGTFDVQVEVEEIG